MMQLVWESNLKVGHSDVNDVNGLRNETVESRLEVPVELKDFSSLDSSVESPGQPTDNGSDVTAMCAGVYAIRGRHD